MKLMHVDASPKGAKSNSRMLSEQFVEMLRDRVPALTVDYLDLAQDPPPHVSGDFARAIYTPEEERTPQMRALLEPSDALCRRLLAADALLFAMPMYNWSMPSSFKAFLDLVVRGGVTYIAGPDGYVGQLARHKVLFLTTRGADLREGSPFAGMDALTPALTHGFGFIGVRDPWFVDAQPLQFAEPEERAAGLARAQAELAVVADRWAAEVMSEAA